MRIGAREEVALVIVGERFEVVTVKVIYDTFVVWEMLRPRPRVG